MSMILDLPKDVEAALASQARAAQMPTEQFLAKMVAQAIENRRRMAAAQLVRLSVENVCSALGIRVLDDTTLIGELRHIN